MPVLSQSQEGLAGQRQLERLAPQRHLRTSAVLISYHLLAYLICSPSELLPPRSVSTTLLLR
jgi:hypothetical protein